MMKKQIYIACIYTICTALLLGVIYPLAVTALARLAFRDKADGQLIVRNGSIIGSHLIGQPFTSASYFHSRPSSAGTGYDAAASSGSNLGSSSKALIDRVDAATLAEGGGAKPVPVDLITTSGSGLDPDISPAAAFYQAERVARERHIPVEKVTALVDANIQPRQFGLLGEPTVNRTPTQSGVRPDE